LSRQNWVKPCLCGSGRSSGMPQGAAGRRISARIPAPPQKLAAFAGPALGPADLGAILVILGRPSLGRTTLGRPTVPPLGRTRTVEPSWVDPYWVDPFGPTWVGGSTLGRFETGDPPPTTQSHRSKFGSTPGGSPGSAQIWVSLGHVEWCFPRSHVRRRVLDYY
jgi:hypothetical protein